MTFWWPHVFDAKKTNLKTEDSTTKCSSRSLWVRTGNGISRSRSFSSLPKEKSLEFFFNRVQQCPVKQRSKCHFFSRKKTETLSRVNRCIFLGVFVQSAIGTARRQMKQCIQSTCGIKHLKRPTVRVFPLWEIIAYHDSTYTVRKIKKAAQVLQAFVDLTWFNSESQRDLLDPYSFAPLI